MTRQPLKTLSWTAIPAPQQRRLIALLSDLAYRHVKSAVNEVQSDEHDHDNSADGKRKNPTPSP